MDPNIATTTLKKALIPQQLAQGAKVPSAEELQQKAATREFAQNLVQLISDAQRVGVNVIPLVEAAATLATRDQPLGEKLGVEDSTAQTIELQKIAELQQVMEAQR